MYDPPLLLYDPLASTGGGRASKAGLELLTDGRRRDGRGRDPSQRLATPSRPPLDPHRHPVTVTKLPIHSGSRFIIARAVDSSLWRNRAVITRRYWHRRTRKTKKYRDLIAITNNRLERVLRFCSTPPEPLVCCGTLEVCCGTVRGGERYALLQRLAAFEHFEHPGDAYYQHMFGQEMMLTAPQQALLRMRDPRGCNWSGGGVYSYRGATTGPVVGYIPIVEGLQLVRWWGMFLLRGCNWSGGG
eukprot:1180387-Prorocentrum_minimum.AAC.2